MDHYNYFRANADYVIVVLIDILPTLKSGGFPSLTT
jgi:hypothetical protein